MKTTIASRVSIAAATALMVLASTAIASPAAKTADKEQPGRCFGLNTCKGTSLCATAKNDCKGLNNCKGQGVLVKTKTACLAEGGSLTDPADKK